MIERAALVALSFGFYSGIMDSNMQIYTDEDFTKRLQELMDTPHPQQDASDFKSAETIVGKTISTPALKDIREIELSLSTSDIADYTDGCIIVCIQARKGSMIKEGRFTCFVYTDDYSPMCNSDVTYKFNRENSINVSIVMLSFRIWLPGKYFLLIRDKNNGSLARIDFEVDKSLNVMQQPLTMCPICSIEDILTTSIENTESSWDVPQS